MHIKPGDRVVVETRDAFEGKIKKTSDKPTKLLQMPFLNPQNGPIMIEGAEKGDALAVHIEAMAPRGPNPRGTCCMIPEFGALTGTYYTATLNDPLPEIVRKIDLDSKWVYWSDRVKLPYRPHIGTLSCSPQIDSINSLTPDNHGGNMDLPDMGPGSITYLPVRSPGARLFIGDAHACQATARSAAAVSTRPSPRSGRSDQGWTINGLASKRRTSSWPSAARPLRTPPASPIANWYAGWRPTMRSTSGTPDVLSQCGMVRLGNFVDPKHTVGAGIRKSLRRLGRLIVVMAASLASGLNRHCSERVEPCLALGNGGKLRNLSQYAAGEFRLGRKRSP
jgi:hypothetical protein